MRPDDEKMAKNKRLPRESALKIDPMMSSMTLCPPISFLGNMFGHVTRILSPNMETFYHKLYRPFLGVVFDGKSVGMVTLSEAQYYAFVSIWTRMRFWFRSIKVLVL